MSDVQKYGRIGGPVSIVAFYEDGRARCATIVVNGEQQTEEILRAIEQVEDEWELLEQEGQEGDGHADTGSSGDAVTGLSRGDPEGPAASPRRERR